MSTRARVYNMALKYENTIFLDPLERHFVKLVGDENPFG